LRCPSPLSSFLPCPGHKRAELCFFPPLGEVGRVGEYRKNALTPPLVSFSPSPPDPTVMMTAGRGTMYSSFFPPFLLFSSSGGVPEQNVTSAFPPPFCFSPFFFSLFLLGSEGLGYRNPGVLRGRGSVLSLSPPLPLPPAGLGVSQGRSSAGPCTLFFCPPPL